MADAHGGLVALAGDFAGDRLVGDFVTIEVLDGGLGLLLGLEGDKADFTHQKITNESASTHN